MCTGWRAALRSEPIAQLKVEEYGYDSGVRARLERLRRWFASRRPAVRRLDVLALTGEQAEQELVLTAFASMRTEASVCPKCGNSALWACLCRQGLPRSGSLGFELGLQYPFGLQPSTAVATAARAQVPRPSLCAPRHSSPWKSAGPGIGTCRRTLLAARASRPALGCSS